MPAWDRQAPSAVAIEPWGGTQGAVRIEHATYRSVSPPGCIGTSRGRSAWQRSPLPPVKIYSRRASRTQLRL